MDSSTKHGMAEGARMRGRATGALFFTGFGAVWAYMGLQATHHASAMMLAVLSVVVVTLLALCATVLRRARRLPPSDARSEFAIRARRMFMAVNIIQWVSIATAVAILILLHMPEYSVPAIAIIVGLHLFPLAGTFRNRSHYVTGGLLVAWSLACIATLPQQSMTGVPALGVGVILLASAFAALIRNSATPPTIDRLPAEQTA